LGASGLWAQGTTGKVQGTVLDPTGQPIANAQVFVLGTSFAALTNDDGFYFINNVPAGSFSMRAQFIGYQPAQIENIRVLADQTLTVDFRLSGAVALEAITITAAETPIVPRDQVSSRSVISGEFIANLPADDPSAVLTLQAGVVQDNAGNFSIRGGRVGETAVYMDGVPVRRIRTGTVQLNLATNALQEASVTTGAIGTEFGDAQSGVISLITRSGGPTFVGTFGYETDEMFGDGLSFGFNRFEGSLSGPVFSNLTFFVSGTAEGNQSDQRGKGWEDVPTYVLGGLDTTVTIFKDGDSLAVDIPRFAQFSGECDASANFGFECQGRRLPFDARTALRGNAKLLFTYGSGSRFSVSALLDKDQNRTFPGGQIFNPLNYNGTATSSQVYVVNWVHQVFRGPESELAFDLNLSYQTDKSRTGNLAPDWEIGHRDPTMGIELSSMKFLVDFDRFSEDVGDGAVTELQSQDDWDQLVRNIQDNLGTRTPYLFRRDLDNAQPYRMNPYGIGTGYITQGQDGAVNLESERRLIGRLNVDWQFDRYNRIKFGGEVVDGQVNVYRGGMLRQIFNDVYSDSPIRYAAYAQDRLDLGDVVLELGVRWDYFDTRAVFPIVPARLFTLPSYDPAKTVEEMTCTAEPCDVNTHVYKRAESHSAWSPRLRVSFPVTDRTNFRLSYAHQVQTPDANSMLSAKNNDLSVTNTNDTFGGDVKHGKSIIFEFGIRHAFSRDLVLDISAYNKDKVSDLAYRIIPFFDPVVGRQQPVNVLTNADFGNSRGVDISLITRLGNLFNGQFAYTFQNSKGTGSNPFTYLNALSRQISAITGDRSPPAQALLRTDLDRTHNFSAAMSLTFPSDYAQGSALGTILRDVSAFARVRVVSGLPFTKLSPAGNGVTTFGGTNFGLTAEKDDDVLNASELPWQQYVDLRVTKGFSIGPTNWAFYADFRNLLNLTVTTGVFAETADVVNEERFENVTSSELSRLEQDAGSARIVPIVKDGEALNAVNIRNCAGWAGSGQEVDCVLLQRAEQRFGDGDGLYDDNEQLAALTAWYNVGSGVQTFYAAPRHIRLGLELSF
jgi:hypothetical protein